MRNSVSKSHFSRSEKTLLIVLGAIQFTHIVDFMIMMPLGPQLMRILNIQPEQFSWLVSAYTFCAGGTGILSAFFLDRFDRKRSLLFFYAGFTLGTLACALANGYYQLLAARALTGAFGGVLGSLVFAIVGDIIAPEKRGTAMGVLMGSFSLASIFGVPFSLYLANHGSWQTPLFILAGVSLLVGLVIMRLMPPLRGHLLGPRSSSWEFLRRVLFQKRPSLALLLVGSMVFGQFALIPFLSPSLVANAGLREDQLPMIYLVGGLFSIISSPIIGRWSDRFGAARVLLITASISLLPFIIITHLGPIGLFGILSSCALFFTCMGGRMVPTITLATGSVLPQYRGMFMSLSSSLQQFAAAFAAFIAGQIVVRTSGGRLEHYNQVGYIAIALTFVSLIIAYFLRNEAAQVT